MANTEKPANINYDIINSATDEQIEALSHAYSIGDEDAIRIISVLDEAAETGNKDAIRFIERFNALVDGKNAEFLRRLSENDPEAVAGANRIINNYREGKLTPGEKDFILRYASPAESDIDLFIDAIIKDPEDKNNFLEGLTPAKVKKLLPEYEVNPQEEAALTYTTEERATLRTGSEEEKAKVREARRERAKRFLCGLTLGDFVTITRAGAPKRKKKPSEDLPQGTVTSVSEYVTNKDIFAKAVFGEKIKGKSFDLIRETAAAGPLTLWTTGKGKNIKNVTIYTRLEPNKEALKAAGITIGKNLSKCAREVYGALLSHYLAGNNLLSIGMVGKIIFNVRNGNDLTETQKNYIINGANELFLTTLYVDTTRTKTHKDGKDKGKNLDGYVSLLEANNIKMTRSEQTFPGRITSAYINGNLVETAIELYKLPTLYALQSALERGQILRAPIELLEIPGRTDVELVTIRAYLMQRIDAMKHANLSRMIIYKNILDEVGVDPTDRAQRNRKSGILERTERILNAWKEKGYIHDYAKLTKEGKPVKGTASLYEIEIRL